MKVLVTGARGFLGSVLCARWHRSWPNMTIVGLDNGERGLNPGEVIREDVWDITPTFLEGVNGIVHFAAGTGSLDRPESELVALNVTMTMRLYQAAAQAGVQWFVYPTTSLGAFIPESPYVKTKDQALRMLHQAPAHMPTVLAFRFCNVIGEYHGCTERRKREVHILPTLVRCAREIRPFIINGRDYPTVDGTPARDFVDVVDVVDYIREIVLRHFEPGYASAQHLPEPWYGATNRIYQVASGESVSVLQLLTYFRSIWPLHEFPVFFGPERAFDTASVTQPDKYFPAWRNLMSWRGSVHREAEVLMDPTVNIREMFE